MPQVVAVSNPLAKQLGDANTVGLQINPYLDSAGNVSKVGFWGATPVAQPAGAFQAAVNLTAPGSVINSYAVSLSPSAVAANTTAEQTATVTGVTSGSLIIINKATAQAGLGIVGVRASAANQIAITFSNDTSGSITPTGSEVYQVIEIPVAAGFTFTSSLTPAAVPANSTSEQNFTVATGNAAVGTVLAVNKPTAQAGLGIGNARVAANNVIAITFINNTASPITPTAAETYLFVAPQAVIAATNHLVYGVNVGTLVGCATITTAEQTVAVAGLLASDVVVGVSKPTVQAGLGIAGYRVSSAGNIGVTFVNPTVGSITPTASEVYKVDVFRAQPAAPMVLYNQLLAPTSVAANTTAEQTFTVTGLVASSSVVVNKPSSQLGLAVVGARVSAASTLAITFQNNTGTAIIPNAEIYSIGNFQTVTPMTGGWVSQAVDIFSGQAVDLLNALRSAAVSLGLIAGS